MRSHYQRAMKLWGGEGPVRAYDPVSRDFVSLERSMASVPTTEYPAIIVSFRSVRLDLSLEASFQFASFFQSEVDLDHACFLIMMEVSSPYMMENDKGEGQSVMGARFAVGLSSTSGHAKAHLNIGAATAALSVNGEHFTGFFNSKGFRDIESLMRLFEIGSGFSIEDMNDLGRATELPVRWATGPDLTELVDIDTHDTRDWLYRTATQAASICYALRTIRKGWSLQNALKEYRHRWNNSNSDYRRFLETVDLMIVRATYEAFGLQGEQIPNDGQRRRAAEYWEANEPPGKTPETVVAGSPFSHGKGYLVEPYLTDEGDNHAVSSLLALVEPEFAYVSGSAPSGAPECTTEITRLEADAVINAGFGDMVTVEGGARAFYLMMETRQLWDLEGRSDSIIETEHVGRGLRVMIKYIDANQRSDLSIGMIAAHSELNYIESSFAIQSFGFNISELTSLPDFVSSSSGSFNAAALREIGALQETVIQAINRQTPSGNEVLHSVDLDLLQAAFGEFDSYLSSMPWALKSIWRRKSLNGALDGVVDQDKDAVQRVYETFFRIARPTARSFDPNEEPDDQIRRLAEGCFNQGL